MKFFACIVLAAVFAIAASEEQVGSAYGHAPAYGHAGPAKTYTYPSPAPSMPCGKNLLFSCAPSVAPVPCSAPAYGYSAPSYGHAAPSYGHGHDMYLGATQGQQEPNPAPQPAPAPAPAHAPKLH